IKRPDGLFKSFVHNTLISVNPVGNPYHPSLVGGVKDVNLRAGQGFPVPLGIGRKCEPPEVPPCESSWTLTRSWTSSLSFTVNKGSQQSITNTLGKSKSTGDESSVAEAISETLEQSVSHTSTKERGGSSSDTVARTLTKTTEVSLANTHTTGTEACTTNTTNEEETSNLSNGGSLGLSLNLESGGSHTAGTENSHTHTTDDAHTNGKSDGTSENHEKHWEAGGGGGVNIFGISLGVQGSGGHSDSTGKNDEDSSSDTHSDQNADTSGSSSSDTTNTNINFGMNSQSNWEASQGRSKGHSNAVTNGHSESDSTESRRSDSTSDALTNSHTEEKNWSNSEADTVGNSHSHTFGKTNTYSTSHTLSEEQSEAKASVSTLENSQQQGIDPTSTLAQMWTSQIELHNCILPVMFYSTRSLHIPWACKNEDKEAEIFSTKIATLDVDRASISMGDMDCKVATVDFEINNPDFETALSTGPTASALSSGQTLDVGKRLVAGTENEYTLTMETDGQLTFKHFNDLLWTSDTGYLQGYAPRARITDDAQITDDGGFTVVDAANAIVFDNSPLQKVQNLTFSALFTQPRIPCDSVCKDGCHPLVVQQLMSNATFNAFLNRQLWDGELLVSNDKKSSLTSVNGTLLFTSPALDAPKAFLEIFRNGTLQFNDPQFKILYTTAGLYPVVNSTYSVYITDEGFLTVADASTIEWQFPDTKPVRELVSSMKVDHINSGQSVISPDGAVSLLFGPQGIQLSNPPSAPLMLSSVAQAAGTRLVLKTDGTLASIDGKGASTGFVAGNPNAGVAPYKLDVYDINGIAVAITDVNGVITWQFPPRDPPKRLTSTTSGPVPGALANYPDRILVGQKISSPSGAHSLFFTASGIALDSRIICNASVAIDSWLIMQSDGNILVKDPVGKVSCATASTNRGTGPFTLAVDDTGYAFMTDSLGVVQRQYPESHLTEISSDGGVLANGISLSHRLWSPSNTYCVVMYGNGVFLARGDNVVSTIYSGTLDWDSQILQQSDGNLVLTEGQAFKGWASNTWNAGTGPYKVRVSDVGAVLMTDSKIAMTNGKCISVGNAASVTAGNAATIQTCNGAANQQFGYDAQKGYLRSKLQPRLCLGVDSLAYQSAVKARECAFEDPNNKFTPDKDMVTSDVNKGLAFDNWNGNSADGTPVVLFNTNAGDIYQHWKFGPFSLKPASLDTNGVMSTSTGLWLPAGHITYKIDNQGRLVMLKDGKWNNVFLKDTGMSNYSGQGRIVIEQNRSISLYDGTHQYYNGGYRTGGTAPYHLRVGNDAKLQLVDNTGFAYWTASMW
ncbi:hypothetical protein HDU89_008964, partial [Geranomyces variabilis]